MVPDGMSSTMQVAHVLLDRVEADFQQSHTGTAGRLAIHDVQIDNQLLTSTHPVVLAHAPSMVHQVNRHPEMQIRHSQCFSHGQKHAMSSRVCIIEGWWRPPCSSQQTSLPRGQLGDNSAQSVHSLLQECILGTAGAGMLPSLLLYQA